MTRHTIELYGGLAMAGAGAVVLLAVILGCAAGLFVLMFNICSGRAQFARKSRRRSAHRGQRRTYTGNGRPADGEVMPLADLLTAPVLPEPDADTKDLPVVTP